MCRKAITGLCLRSLRMAVAIGIVCLSQGVSESETRARQDSPEQKQEEARANPEFHAFAEHISQIEKTLRAEGTLEVELQSHIYQGSGTTPTASILIRYQSDAPRFRLDVFEVPRQEPVFQAVYDGKILTRFSGRFGKFSRVETGTPLQEMQPCGLTHWFTGLVGGDFLLTTEPSEIIFSELTHVHVLADEGGKKHFRVTRVDGHQADYVFSEGASGLPERIQLSSRLQIADGQHIENLRVTNVTWKPGASLAADAFELKLPSTAVEVEDLTASVAGRGREELVGNPLPASELQNLDLQPVAPAAAGQPRLLYFWATWAAPSAEQIPSMLEFAAGLKAKGVVIESINVAEPPEQVKAFLEANKIEIPVALDREGAFAHALRLTNLPCVVLVDGQNVVQGIFEGANPEIRGEIAERLDKILASKPRMP